MRRRRLTGRARGTGAVVLLAILGACTPDPLTPATSEFAPQTTPTIEATETPAGVTAEPSPTPGCAERTGQVVQDRYPGMLVEGEVPFRIYLPACAGDQGEVLPVLYLFHGYPFDESHWDELGIDELAETWIQAHEAPRFAIVMARLPEPLFRSSDGGPGSYEAEMLQGLLPAVEGEYPVGASPENRAIAGISRGGVWSLEIGMRHPEVFGAVAALSPALSVNHARPAYDPLVLADRDVGWTGRYFLAAGEYDWARLHSERLASALQARGHQVVLQILPGGHDAATWVAAIPEMLTYVLNGW